MEQNEVMGRMSDGKSVRPILIDEDGRIFPIDPSTGAVTVIQQGQHEVNEGDAFVCHYVQTVSDTNDKSIISFLTPDSTFLVHLTMSVYASTAANAFVYEAPTITNNTGASLTVFNRRRANPTQDTRVIDTSSNPNTAGQATFFTEVTMGNVTSGTEMAHVPLVAGDGPKAVGGESRDEREWILKRGTLYAFVVHSTSDLDNTHWISLNWHEHEDKQEV